MSDSDLGNAGIIQQAIRGVGAILDKNFFGLLVVVFQIFFNVASAELFTGESILKFVGRVQLILGVFTMFQLAMSILKGIVNPDNFFGKDKGVKSIISRIVIALIMLTLITPISIPAAKNEYEKQINNNGILFGASVTVTKNNMKEVLSDEFVSNLKKAGTKGIVDVEYVPVNKETRDLAPDDETREEMMVRLDYLRSKETDMVLVAFPGDERATNGCLAAGRGFFHINAYGDAEPCPFSPYSDTNLLKTSLREALSSPLFCKLKEKGNLEDEHVGGCVLFEKQEHVQDILKGNTI